ncbi:MAG: phage tail terminator-like protein [Reyranellaceae bacterium]
MAGDTFRDAFRAELTSVVSAAGIAWPVRDLINTAENPDASGGFIAIEFLGGSEEQFTTGAPGDNLFRENGQVTIRVYAPQEGSVTTRDQAERYAEAIRVAFRGRRFACGADRTIRIDGTQPMGGGQDEAGLWAEAIGLGYEMFNTG